MLQGLGEVGDLEHPSVPGGGEAEPRGLDPGRGAESHVAVVEAEQHDDEDRERQVEHEQGRVARQDEPGPTLARLTPDGDLAGELFHPGRAQVVTSSVPSSRAYMIAPTSKIAIKMKAR